MAPKGNVEFGTTGKEIKMEAELKTMADCICKVCDSMRDLLLEKNASYGNSAAKPIQIFSKASAMQQINTRIDDKLNRIKCGGTFDNEDTEKDLTGYLILKRAVRILNQR